MVRIQTLMALRVYDVALATLLERVQDEKKEECHERIERKCGEGWAR